MASFTVCTDRVLLTPAAARITMLYRDSRNRERQHVAKFLAVEATSNAFNHTSEADRTYLKSLLSQAGNLLSDDNTDTSYVLLCCRDPRLNSLSNENARPPAASAEPEFAPTVENLERQRAKEASAELRESESMKALKVMVSESLGLTS